MRRAVWVVLAVGFSSTAARAENWPSWRGPRGDGTSTEKDIPLRWSPTENVAWKTRIPGKGHSSPVVWGDRVFLTSCLGQAPGQSKPRVLIALDRRDGKILWQREVVRAPLEKKHTRNSHASSTPATDGKHVWVTFLADPEIVLACYDVAGKEIWRKSPGKFFSRHGYCSSLIPFKDLIILNADQDAKGPDRAYIVACEKATGKERWRIDRPNRIRSYTPPVIFTAAGKEQMVLSGCKCVTSYDPNTGKPYWIVDGPTEQFVASMIHTDGVFVISGGYPTLHILGIRPDGSGNVTKSHVIWHVRKGPSYVPSPIPAGKDFFIVSDYGTVSCIEAKTGKYLWQEKLGRLHGASPVSAEGRLYFPDYTKEGITWVLAADTEFKLLAKNPLGEPVHASPAISQGQIFLRGEKHLFCIGRGAKAQPPR